MGYFSCRHLSQENYCFLLSRTLRNNIRSLLQYAISFFWLSTGNIRMSEPEARTFPLTGFDSNLSAHPIDQALTDG